MKTRRNQFIWVVICILFCNFTLETKGQETDLYRSSMQKMLGELDVATEVQQLLNYRNQFERISLKFTEKWQPVYYMAYCDIQMVFYDTASQQNKNHLDNARLSLEKLETMPGIDASEVNVLWGYYYNALLLCNPASTQQLFGEVIRYYEKALTVNPENPRAIILRAFYNQFLPPFVKLKIDAAKEVEKAKELFNREERSIDAPCWGTYFIDKVKIEEVNN